MFLINFLFRFSAPLAFASVLAIGAIDAAEASHKRALTTAAQCYEMMAGGLIGNADQCSK